MILMCKIVWLLLLNITLYEVETDSQEWVHKCVLKPYPHWQSLKNVKKPAHCLLPGFGLGVRLALCISMFRQIHSWHSSWCNINSFNKILAKVIAMKWQIRLYILRCSEPTPCRESFHCILAGKLCPTALSPLPSVPVKLTLPEMQKHNIYLASQLVAVWNWRKWVTSNGWGKKTGTVLDLNLSSFTNLHLFLDWLGKTHLTGLEVLQRGRRIWKQQDGQRPLCLRDGESVGKRTASIFFLVTGQKMNMSARVVFGKGNLTPKQLSFAFPQTESLRKGSRGAGGKRKMFSFSLRCRLGIIRGRTKGKAGRKAM